MKQLVVPVTLAFVILYSGQSNSVGNQYLQTKRASHPSLRLTTSVTEQAYCSNGDVRMFLRMIFTNTGTEPIILQKYSVSTARYAVSRSLEAATKRRYESVVHSHNDFSIPPNPTHGPKPPTESFVILAPAESHEFDTKSFQFAFTINNRSKHLKDGLHFLQFDVMTWNEDITLAKELSDGWRKYGILWWEGVTSEPMEFRIEKPSSSLKCY